MSRHTDTELLYKMLAQTVQLCHAQGIRHVVLSPGSRSAPVALSFMRHPEIKHYIITDERAAAYTALGIAKQLQEPVAVVCTSGTAALNFAPAIAEAFFSEIPLIVFTADRPPEWIGQADNQSIHQQNLYGKHIKSSFTLPVDYIHADAQWHTLRMVNEAILIAKSPAQGPVHINIPLREPLYLEEEVNIINAENTAPKIISGVEAAVLQKTDKKLFDNEILSKLHHYKKIAVVAGMHPPSTALKNTINLLSGKHEITFFPDITSNLHGFDYSINYYDLIIDFSEEKIHEDELAPELVITFGGPLVSKNLKNLLRGKSVKEHWHISEAGTAADTFRKLTKIISLSPEDFFAQLQHAGFIGEANYYRKWLQHERKIKHWLESNYYRLPYSETRAVMEIMQYLPEKSVLHLGNSLPIRHASVFPLLHKEITVFSNRGTSGIDGSLSTAAGQSMVSKDNEIHTLILGDLSFMYDRNGLWNNYLNGNFKIIIINNHGGRIFESLPGAAKQKEIKEYFVTEQPLNFKYTALQHNCGYLFCDKEEDLRTSLDKLFASADTPVILELDFKTTASLGEIRRLLKEKIKN